MIINPTKTDDLVDLWTERMSYGPSAVGRISTPSGELVVFVKQAAPNEKVRVRLTNYHKSYWDAELVEVLIPSKDRVEAPCKVYGKCGGCQWQHLKYEAQLNAKREILLHQMNRFTKKSTSELESCLIVHSAEESFGYRSRVQVRGDALGIGFYESKTHSIVYTDRCLVAHPKIQEAWVLQIEKLKLVNVQNPFKIEWTVTEAGQLISQWNKKHSSDGFTQINHGQNEVLRNVVKKLSLENIPNTSVLFDLYGGNGNLSKELCNSFDFTLCVDSHNKGMDPTQITPTALVEHKNQLIKIRSHCETFLSNEYWRDYGLTKCDCVILDPPRKGLTGSVIQKIKQLQPSRVVLVSCDPMTVARDLQDFLLNYNIVAIHLIDMFPQTFHMETVIRLDLKQMHLFQQPET